MSTPPSSIELSYQPYQLPRGVDDKRRAERFMAALDAVDDPQPEVSIGTKELRLAICYMQHAGFCLYAKDGAATCDCGLYDAIYLLERAAGRTLRCTPPSSIEEVAKRVKELRSERERSMTNYAYTRTHNLAAEMGDLAPQLAEWVEKALPVIEAARRISACSSLTVTFAPVDGEDQGYALWMHTDEGRATLADLATSLASLDTPSSLAAEGAAQAPDPPHKGQKACRCTGPSFCTCNDASCWCNWG